MFASFPLFGGKWISDLLHFWYDLDRRHTGRHEFITIKSAIHKYKMFQS